MRDQTAGSSRPGANSAAGRYACDLQCGVRHRELAHAAEPVRVGDVEDGDLGEQLVDDRGDELVLCSPDDVVAAAREA